MVSNTWVHLDELRENWLFLLLGTAAQSAESSNQSELLYWEFGVANADQFIDTETQCIGYGPTETEAELLTTLLEELADYRYTGATIITPTTWTVQQLRRCLATHSDDYTSLRGFHHISIEELLTEYLGQTLAAYGLDRKSRPTPRLAESDSDAVVDSGAVREYWSCWRQIFRLIPSDELAGGEL